ncbi:MAG: methyltransferase [bacterium]|nr:methyltransferase [bacterium]
MSSSATDCVDENAVMISDYISVQNTKKVYDKIAKNYDDFAKAANYSVPSWLRRIFPTMTFDSEEPCFLDLACGNGLLGRIAQQFFSNLDICGIDLSEKMIIEAKKRSNYKKGITYDLNNGLPINLGFFDCVIAIGLFDFFEDSRKLLTDISESLRIDGHLLCNFEASVLGMPRKAVSKVHDINRYTYSLAEVVALFNDLDFDIIEIKKQRAYTSPSTGEKIIYYLVHAKKKENKK